MAVSLQQTTDRMGLVGLSGALRPETVGSTVRPRARSRAEGAEATPPLTRRRPDFARAGFGKGTVSAPAAAARTLHRGLESARRVVPTLAEVREDVRARLDEQRQARIHAAEDQAGTLGSAPVPDAMAEARQFANLVNQTAGSAQAQAEGQQPSANGPGAAIQINGQVENYTRIQGGGAGLPPVPSLNVLV